MDTIMTIDAKGMCRLEVPPVKAAVEAGAHTAAEALAEEIRHEVSRRGRWVEVELCDCTAESGCKRASNAV